MAQVELRRGQVRTRRQRRRGKIESVGLSLKAGNRRLQALGVPGRIPRQAHVVDSDWLGGLIGIGGGKPAADRSRVEVEAAQAWRQCLGGQSLCQGGDRVCGFQFGRHAKRRVERFDDALDAEVLQINSGRQPQVRVGAEKRDVALQGARKGCTRREGLQ